MRNKSIATLFAFWFACASALDAGLVSATDPDAEGWPFDDLIPPYSKYLKTDDGVDLATLVYENGAFDINERAPTLLIRSPYDISGQASDLTAWHYATTYPFFVVTQDMRGRYHSGGVDTLFGTDWHDGWKTIWYLKNDPNFWWWNGKIGSWGSSALCINQYTYAGENVPELRAQYLGVGSPEQYDHVFFQGGAFRYNMIMQWSDNQGYASHQYAINEIATHPKKDSWWAKRSLEMGNRFANVHASGVHFGGWDDPFSAGTVRGFVGYNYEGASDARGHQVLVMGGIGHGFVVGEIAWPNAAASPADGMVPFGSSGLEDFLYKADLLDQYGPRGSPGYEAAWSSFPHVFYYVYGDPATTGSDPKACSWRIADDWPVPAVEERWYLHPGVDQWSGALLPSPPGSASTLSYVYDPNDYCPTNGGNNLFDASFDPGFQSKFGTDKIGQGSTDQRGLGSSGAPGVASVNRSDVLEFWSPVLSAPYEFTGDVNATLYIQSSAPDTDFVAKLIDVFPDGREMLVTDGIIRACRMNGFDTTTWMEPGNTYQLNVDLWPKAWRFGAGHRIKLLVTSSNYPRFQRNPNLANEVIPATITNYQVAVNTLVMAPGYPSHLTLPVTDGARAPLPDVNLTSPYDGAQLNDDPVHVAWTISEWVNHTDVYVNDVWRAGVDNDTAQQVDLPASYFDANQWNEIKIVGADWWGQTATDAANVYFSDPPPKPSLNVTTPANFTTTRVARVEVAWNASQFVTRVDVRVNGTLQGTLYNGSTSPFDRFNASLSDAGWNNVSVEGWDPWGQVASDSLLLFFDPPPAPSVTVTSPTHGSTVYEPNVTVTWTYSPFVNRTEVLLNNVSQGWVSNASGPPDQFNVTGLLAGWNNITLRGLDWWWQVAEAWFQVYVDAPPLSVNVTSPTRDPQFSSYLNEVWVEWEFSGDVEYFEVENVTGYLSNETRLDVDDVPNNRTLVAGFVQGVNTRVYVRARDRFGQVAEDYVDLFRSHNYLEASLVANATWGYAPLHVAFSDDTLATKSVVWWSWDFGDGATSDLRDPVHAYLAPGTFTVTLTVRDVDGVEDSTTTTVTVHQLVAAVQFDVGDGYVPFSVEFSDDSNHTAALSSWFWDFGDGSNSTERDPTHVFDAAGTFLVTLTVTDSNGRQASATAWVTARLLRASISANVTVTYAPALVAFSDASDSSEGIVSWSWDFGDGATSDLRDPVHAYLAPGNYTVTLTVTDGRGAKSTAAFVVYVLEPPAGGGGGILGPALVAVPLVLVGLAAVAWRLVRSPPPRE
ncbi:MAG: hypothetical protein Kow0069_16940 [Promethearchaeota archaeon]